MKLFYIALLSFLPLFSFAQPVKTPEMIADSFFVILKTGSIDKAMDYIVGTNPYMLQAKETIDNIKIKLQKSLPLIGKFYGQDLYMKKEVGPNYVHMKYLLRYDRQPVILTFVFYRADKVWKLQNILFEDKPENDMDDIPNSAAKHN